MVATCAERKDVDDKKGTIKTESKPSPGLFINDGNFMAKFYHMQGKEPPVSVATVKEETKVEISSSSSSTPKLMSGFDSEAGNGGKGRQKAQMNDYLHNYFMA